MGHHLEVLPRGAPWPQSEALLHSGLEDGCKLSREEHALRRKDLGFSGSGQGGGPWDLGYSIGGHRRGKGCLFKRPTSCQIRGQGACFSSGGRCARLGESAFCFLGNSISSQPGNFHQPRPSARGAVPELRECNTAERRVCFLGGVCCLSTWDKTKVHRPSGPNRLISLCPDESRMELGACGKSFKVEIFSWYHSAFLKGKIVRINTPAAPMVSLIFFLFNNISKQTQKHSRTHVSLTTGQSVQEQTGRAFWTETFLSKPHRLCTNDSSFFKVHVL